jgi:hypothetical protein
LKRVPRKSSAEAAATTPRTAASLPCVKLKRLRERAGVTAIKCSKALGLTSPNSWYRYESVERMGDTPIPDHIIEGVMSLLVGNGMPPVTADELLAISSAHRLLSVRGRASSATPNGRILPQPVVAPVFPESDTGTPLVVRYRAEKGVYMDTAALHRRTFGVAPITAAKDIKGEQFCVLVADGPTAGTVLQCVAPSAYSTAQMLGRRVVVVSERQGMGLAEVVVGTVDSTDGNVAKLKDPAGKAITGDIYGVVVASYSRE